MYTNLKKWMTVGAVVAAAVVMMSGGNAEARKETQYAPNCDPCSEQFRRGTIVCELVSCLDGCQYACREMGPVDYEQ